MPRRPRIHLEGGIYHAILRGNHRHPIFYQNADRTQLDEIVARAAAAEGVRIHAYCWMPNHIHLAVQVGERPLGHFIQRVASQISTSSSTSIAEYRRCRSFDYLIMTIIDLRIFE